ncbi:MAG TPA: adenylate/guanylate cyclase domain-containing protein [Acetobacteraceae bacterium]|nr:adenylate/guanylate cyclase domain-containing protein [Acetobacteraceae bacterium]
MTTAADDRPDDRSEGLRSWPEPTQIGPDLGSGRIKWQQAAFLALDIRNYGAMVSRDEVAAHKNVGKDLATVVRQIHRYNGRVLQFSGDGLLAAFASARSTLQAALRIQSTARKRNIKRQEEHRIEYRIGVNAGPIVVQGGRVGGDTVNIAARLEQIAEAGGICVSESVYAQVHHMASAIFTNIGAIRLKNVRSPVVAYRVSVRQGRTDRNVVENPLLPRQTETAEYLPSIAILPFSNLHDTSTPDYFSDGVVEDIIVSLAGLRELRVISRTSTLSYLSGETDVREVGRMLGVRYVLSGSIRRSANAIRVSVELSDAQSGFSVWAETSEFPPGDLFEMQDHLVRRIVSRIAPHIREEELHRAMRVRPESMTAYDRLLQALHLMDYMDKDMFRQAGDVLKQAMDADPRYAMPVAWSVWWHIIWVGQGWSTDPMGDYVAANALAERTILLDQNNALGLAIMAHMRSYMLHDYDGALIYFARAIEAGSSNPIVLAMYALTLAYIGRGEEAVRYANDAIRLSPLDHKMFLFHNIMAWVYFSCGAYHEAAKWARASDGASPRFTANLRVLIGSLTASGAEQEARAAAARLMSLEPSFRISRYEQTLQPFRDAAIRTKLLTSLAAAGLPR